MYQLKNRPLSRFQWKKLRRDWRIIFYYSLMNFSTRGFIFQNETSSSINFRINKILNNAFFKVRWMCLLTPGIAAGRHETYISIELPRYYSNNIKWIAETWIQLAWTIKTWGWIELIYWWIYSSYIILYKHFRVQTSYNLLDRHIQHAAHFS